MAGNKLDPKLQAWVEAGRRAKRRSERLRRREAGVAAATSDPGPATETPDPGQPA